MNNKKTTKTVRMDDVLERRVRAYAETRGVKESEAIRGLLEQGLACEGLSVFATPVGALIRDVIEAEFSLMRDDMDSRNDALEDRVARVCSRGTKASLQAAAQLNDLSRIMVPAWREVPAEELWRHYSAMGGAMQAGRAYRDVRNGG
jgi:hypothetical protein